MAGKSAVAADEESGRREKAGADGSEPRAGSGRGGPSTRDLAHSLGLEQRSDRPGFRGPRGYSSVLAQRLHEGRDRSAEEISCARANSRQGQVRVGCGRGGSVCASGGPPELDAAPSGGRDREARGPAPLALKAVRGAAPKGDFHWR